LERIRKRGTAPFLAVLLIAFAACISGVSAQDVPERKPGIRKFSGGDRTTIEQMDLKPEQIEKLKKLQLRFKEERDGIIQEMRDKRCRLVDMLMEEEPDRKKLESMIDEILKLESRRQKTLLEEYFEVRRNLEPEQQKRFTRKMIMSIMRER
jgi:Spy/CpxP family protein refolding chaperone